MRMPDAVVIGAGQAGISLSWCLRKRGIRHTVLEKDRAFSAWHGRWDAFRMNTANWMNILPGSRGAFVGGGDPNGIATRDEALVYFETTLRLTRPPLVTGSEVPRIREQTDG